MSNNKHKEDLNTKEKTIAFRDKLIKITQILKTAKRQHGTLLNHDLGTQATHHYFSITRSHKARYLSCLTFPFLIYKRGTLSIRWKCEKN